MFYIIKLIMLNYFIAVNRELGYFYEKFNSKNINYNIFNHFIKDLRL